MTNTTQRSNYRIQKYSVTIKEGVTKKQDLTWCESVKDYNFQYHDDLKVQGGGDICLNAVNVLPTNKLTKTNVSPALTPTESVTATSGQ